MDLLLYDWYFLFVPLYLPFTNFVEKSNYYGKQSGGADNEEVVKYQNDKLLYRKPKPSLSSYICCKVAIMQINL